MKKFLNEIRKSNKEIKTSKKAINTLLIFLLGIILGIFSKWLDNIAIDDTIWWQHILGVLDLRNVFSGFSIWLFIALIISVYSNSSLRASLNTFLFFLGMCISYHLYTIIFSGFNPSGYMMIWYGLTIISPILAFICWYAKSKNKTSMIISGLIFSVMMINCFSIGLWYFYPLNVINTLIFIGTILILYSKPKNTILSLIIAIILSFILKSVF